MVLSLMRKHAKSWLIKFLIAIIAVVFVFYFGYSFTADQALKIAYVNGEVISGPEYQKAYRDMISALQRRYQDQWNDNMVKAFNVKQRALQGIIDQRLMTQAAKRLGIDVTESECQRAIMGYPAFQVNGRFDIRRYQSILSQNRMKPEDFEATMTQDLLDKKLKQFLFAFLDVTEQGVLEYYTFVKERIKIGFVEFNPEDFKKSVKFDQAALKEYFDSHKESYRVPKKIKVTYIEIDPVAFKGGINVSEKEIQSFYEYNNEAYSQPKQVKARHILFKLGEDALKEAEDKVRKAAKEILAKAREGGDFATLAKEHSEGPTKSKGGDLGYFKKGQMMPTFDEAAFNMKKGEISDLVRTQFGYHIIKVEDIKEASTKSLEDVRDEIVDTLAMSVATELAHEKGLSVIDQMPYDIELSDYAKQYGLEAKRSSFFSKDEPVSGIDGSEKIGETLFALGKNETTELFALGEKFYIFQVAESKESYLPPLKDVAEKVKDDYTAHLAAQAATAAASRYLEQLKEGNAWDKLAEEKGMKIEESAFFTRQEPIPKIGYAPGLAEAAFRLNSNKRYPDIAFVTNTGVFVIRWLAREGIDDKKFREEEKEYRSSLVQTKHGRIFDNWLQNLRKNADIEILTPVSGES
ncbi:MAG: SurA N-terminal domain-containing protein [Deltaproteobacteria bacterium]|nr:SurA N-terminal domain-containing protein [Deltaproteobacteria bacterium]